MEEKEETISEMVEEMSRGQFDAAKKRKRFKSKVKWDGRVIMLSDEDSSDSDESNGNLKECTRPKAEEDSDTSEEESFNRNQQEDSLSSGDGQESSSVIPHSPARADSIMSTSEALQRLTNDAILDDEKSEWLIVKVPKALRAGHSLLTTLMVTLKMNSNGWRVLTLRNTQQSRICWKEDELNREKIEEGKDTQSVGVMKIWISRTRMERDWQQRNQNKLQRKG
jgi:hypothetical protein